MAHGTLGRVPGGGGGWRRVVERASPSPLLCALCFVIVICELLNSELRTALCALRGPGPGPDPLLLIVACSSLKICVLGPRYSVKLYIYI
jgi:hypothetical protein